MIELSREDLLVLADAAALLPRRRGKKVHIATLYRWAKAGVRGVRLEVLAVGGVTYTSRQALQRFAERLTCRPAPNTNVAAKQEADVSRAAEVLDRAGI